MFGFLLDFDGVLALNISEYGYRFNNTACFSPTSHIFQIQVL
jgi:hypothetical protein